MNPALCTDGGNSCRPPQNKLFPFPRVSLYYTYSKPVFNMGFGERARRVQEMGTMSELFFFLGGGGGRGVVSVINMNLFVLSTIPLSGISV